MRKALMLIPALLVFSAYIHAFQMKNPENRFDAALAFSQSLTSSLQMQGTFNMNESFYVGLRFTTGSSVYYYSAAARVLMLDEVEYVLDFSNAALILGAQFGAFNERFNVYLNAMPGYGFGVRKKGKRPSGTILNAAIIDVVKTEPQSFFAPSVELGFNCQLTDNLILSTGWQVTLVSVSDMPWEHYPWLIKTSETDALAFSIPARLSWRF
jgi:hypothetical protein